MCGETPECPVLWYSSTAGLHGTLVLRVFLWTSVTVLKLDFGPEIGGNFASPLPRVDLGAEGCPPQALASDF